MARELAITYRPVAELYPAARNPRTHSPDQLAALATALKTFGFNQPVAVAREGKRKSARWAILAGHARTIAAKTIWAAGGAIRNCANGKVPTVDLSDLNAAERRAYLIADNKIAERAGWDMEALKIEFAELRDLGIDLAPLGFSVGEIDVALMGIVVGETDANGAWNGMPSYDHEDKTAYRTIALHFKDDAAVAAFAALIGQKITADTRFIWFPETEIERYADKRYAAAE